MNSRRLAAETEDELYLLYEQYTDSLKPLLAFVETKVVKFPGPILNELRAVNDHVSRCFTNLNPSECHNGINIMLIPFIVFLKAGGGFYCHYSRDLQNASKEEVSTGDKSFPLLASSIAAIVSAFGS